MQQHTISRLSAVLAATIVLATGVTATTPASAQQTKSTSKTAAKKPMTGKASSASQTRKAATKPAAKSAAKKPTNGAAKTAGTQSGSASSASRPASTAAPAASNAAASGGYQAVSVSQQAREQRLTVGAWQRLQAGQGGQGGGGVETNFSLAFSPDGTMKITDASGEKSGRWRMEGYNLLITPDGGQETRYTLEGLRPQMLILRSNPQTDLSASYVLAGSEMAARMQRTGVPAPGPTQGVGESAVATPNAAPAAPPASDAPATPPAAPPASNP